jgi:hypothetical protein
MNHWHQNYKNKTLGKKKRELDWNYMEHIENNKIQKNQLVIPSFDGGNFANCKDISIKKFVGCLSFIC